MTRKKTTPEELLKELQRMGFSLGDSVDEDDDWDDEKWDDDRAWVVDRDDELTAPADLIAEGIDYLTVADHRRIAKGFGWPLKGQLRAEILAQMDRHYRDPEQIERALATVSAEDRQSLALLSCVGVTTRPSAERQIPLLAARLAAQQPGMSLTPRQLDSLIARGLVFQLEDVRQIKLTVVPSFVTALPRLRLLAAPADMSALVMDSAVEPLTAVLVAWQVVAEAGDVPVVDPYETGSYDGGGLWRSLPAEDARTRKTHRALRIPTAPGPYPEALRAALRRAAGIDEPGAGSFLGGIMLATALVTSDSRKLAASPAGRDELLSLGADQLCLDLVAAWLELPYGIWDELTVAKQRGEALSVYRTLAPWHFGPDDLSLGLMDLRSASLISLRWLPGDRDVADGWVSMADMDALLHVTYPDIVAPTDKQAPWYVAVTPGTPLDGRRELDWRRGHAPIWQLIFEGPLRWLGIVETARDAHGRLAALRLTPAGAELIHGTTLAMAPGTGITWGEALDVTVTPGTARGAALAELMRLAETDGMVDGQLHFRFTPLSAQRAFQAGAVPADIHARLVAAGAPPPNAVAEAIARWYDSWGTTHRYDDLALLEVADETLLHEILARPGVAEHGVFRCGPTALALDPAAVDKVVAQLRRWGYLAKVVDA